MHVARGQMAILKKRQKTRLRFLFSPGCELSSSQRLERKELWRRGATALLFFGRFCFFCWKQRRDPKAVFPALLEAGLWLPCPAAASSSRYTVAVLALLLRRPPRGFPSGYILSATRDLCSSLPLQPDPFQPGISSPGGFVQPLFRPSPGSQGIGAACAPRARSGAPPAAAGEPSHLPCSPGAASAPAGCERNCTRGERA